MTINYLQRRSDGRFICFVFELLYAFLYTDSSRFCFFDLERMNGLNCVSLSLLLIDVINAFFLQLSDATKTIICPRDKYIVVYSFLLFVFYHSYYIGILGERVFRETFDDP